MNPPAKTKKKVCENADIVISTTISATERLKVRYPTMQDKFVTLPNGYDPADFSSFSKQPSPSSKLRIKYIGSVGGSRNPEILFEVLR